MNCMRHEPGQRFLRHCCYDNMGWSNAYYRSELDTKLQQCGFGHHNAASMFLENFFDMFVFDFRLRKAIFPSPPCFVGNSHINDLFTCHVFTVGVFFLTKTAANFSENFEADCLSEKQFYRVFKETMFDGGCCYCCEVTCREIVPSDCTSIQGLK